MLYNSMPTMKRIGFESHAKLDVFKRKVEQAQNLVEKALKQMDRPYCAFSTGKDSQVASHLVWSVNPNIPGVYWDADCAYPESYEYLDLIAQERTIIKWKCEPMLDTFERLGGPDAPGIENATMKSTVYDPLKELLAKYHFDGVFVGLRAEESRGRANSIKYDGTLWQYKRDDVLRCLPVAHFSYKDIWAYIVSCNLPYNRIYDKMWNMYEREQRVSYWAGESNRSMGRWYLLRTQYPELWNKFAARFPEVRQFC